jgi:pyruvate/2-oxoglutarate dehydrogenase complex dihydrolipoamide dehydrogenase (E3) component
LETGETRGFMKAVIDADTQQILGAAVLGAEGGEIMTIIQVAMMGKLPATAMADAIFTMRPGAIEPGAVLARRIRPAAR